MIKLLSQHCFYQLLRNTPFLQTILNWDEANAYEGFSDFWMLYKDPPDFEMRSKNPLKTPRFVKNGEEQKWR